MWIKVGRITSLLTCLPTLSGGGHSASSSLVISLSSMTRFSSSITLLCTYAWLVERRNTVMYRNGVIHSNTKLISPHLMYISYLPNHITSRMENKNTSSIKYMANNYSVADVCSKRSITTSQTI